MTPKEEKERIETWINALWAMWLEAMKAGYRQVNLQSIKDAMEAGFYAGRNSVGIIPRARKARKK